MTSEKRFCPNCGSTSVEPETGPSNRIGAVIGNQNKWKCRECSYTGLMPTGDPEKARDAGENENIKFEPEKQEKSDFELGKAYFRYFTYFGLPAALTEINVSWTSTTRKQREESQSTQQTSPWSTNSMETTT